MGFLIAHAPEAIRVFGRSARGYGFRMSIIDKITGRTKKAAGDIAGDSSLRSEGRREERKGEEKEKLADAQDRVEEKAAGCGRPRAPHLSATITQ